jgi:ABC transport system ATP-binding/permease protein
MQKLVIQDDEGKTTVVPLIRDEITIGRKEGNTIRLTERNVSRRHARIVRNNGSVVIEDLNSYNGVRVNGSRIQGRCQISMSDRIQIGDYIIELKAEGLEAGVPGTEGYGERTQPMERVDALATTPVPQISDTGTPTAIVHVNQIAAQMQPANYGAAAFSSTDPGLSPVGDAGPAGRVVVLSTNFAGQEFELVKPAMVIGRTEDNDICINHRSISRHHAKIVRESGRYAIVDLQSSNGVRVNGEEYGKVELRRGDVVDLGHVRLRFIEPGEDFVFGRDAVAMDIAPQKKGKGWLYALIGIGVIGAIVVIALVAGGGGGGDEDKTAAAGDTGGDKPAKEPSGAPPGGNGNPTNLKPENGGNVPQPPAGDSEADKALAAAQAAIEAENWDEAKKLAEAARTAGADEDKVDQIVKQATKESANKKRYENFKKATGKGDLKIADGIFDQIDGDSVYKEQARPDYDRLVDEYTRRKVSEAEKLAAKGKCADMKRLAEEGRRISPSIGDEIDAVNCGGVAVAPKDPSDPVKPPKDPPKDPVKPPKDPPPDPPPGGDGDSAKSAAELTAEAREAARSGQWGKALRLCESAAAKDRGDQDNAMVCALAACNIKSASKAKKHMDRLKSPSRKGMARQTCLKNGVDVPID